MGQNFGASDDLRGARFRDTDLSGAVMRGVEIRDAEIDSPWLLEGENSLLVNGVDVLPYVDAELDRRFPGREQRRAADPASLRAAWAALEAAWGATIARAEALPAGSVDLRVDGEWSFAETLRHLVLATDLWLRHAVLGVEKPFHPLGRIGEYAAEEGFDVSVFSPDQPTWAEVLEARADRVAQVRAFLATLTPEELAIPRQNPWAPQHPETTLSCLHTITEEEWEHHRYAVRDLERIASGVADG